MPHHRSYHRSRTTRTNAQESHLHRHHNHVEEVEDGIPAADEEQLSSLNAVDDQPSPRESTSRAGGAWAIPRSFDAVSSTHASMPTWANHDTGGAHVMFDNNPGYYRPPLQLDSSADVYASFIEPVWQRSPTTYQASPQDRLQAPMSPATSSLVDEYSMSFRGTGYSQSGSTPSHGYQPSQDWSASRPHDRTAEVGYPSDREPRRWSMQARRGSEVGPSGQGQCDNVCAYVPIEQSPSIEEHDSSGSSGGDTTQDDRYQYVRVYMSGNDDPWSPESLHQAHRSRYQ